MIRSSSNRLLRCAGCGRRNRGIAGRDVLWAIALSRRLHRGPAAIPFVNRTRQLYELVTYFVRQVCKSICHSLNARSIALRRFIQALQKLERLDKVVIGRRANDWIQSLGDQADRRIFDLQKNIQRIGRHRFAVSTIGIFGIQDHDGATLQSPFQQRPRVFAFRIKNMFIVGPVDQFHVADRPGTIVGQELERSCTLDRHLRNAHQLPDVDNDFGLTNQEKEHVRVDIDCGDR